MRVFGLFFVCLFFVACEGIPCTSSAGDIYAPGGATFVTQCSVASNCPPVSECNQGGEVGTTVTCEINSLPDSVWTCEQHGSNPRWSRVTSCSGAQTCNNFAASVVNSAPTLAEIQLLAQCTACPPTSCCNADNDVGSVLQCTADPNESILWGCVVATETPYFRQVCNAYCGSDIGSITGGVTCAEGGNCPAAGCCDQASQAGSTIACLNGAGATVSYVCKVPGPDPEFEPVPLVVVCPSSVGAVGTPYSDAISATGGSGDYTTFSTSGGPAWGSVASSTGVLSGNPTIGTHTFSVTVEDSVGATASRQCTIVVTGPPSITCQSLPTGEVTVNYPAVQAATASGGTGTGYTFTASFSPSNAGMRLLGDGRIRSESSSGPTASGTFNVQITVEDSSGGSATVTCPLTILPPPSPSCPTPTEGYSNRVYTSSNVAVTGGTQSGMTFSIVGTPSPSRSAPAFTPSFSGTRKLTGLLNAVSQGSPVVYTYVIRVEDSAGGFGTVQCTLTVYPPPTLACPSKDAITQGETLSTQASLGGGDGDYTVTGTNMGPLSVNNNGLVTSGALNSVTTITYTLSVTSGTTVQRTCTLKVLALPTISCPNYPEGQVGTVYTAVLPITNVDAADGTFSKASGTFPNRININANNGAVSSSQALDRVETDSFRLGVTDAAGKSATSDLCTIVVNSGPQVECPAEVATTGVAYASMIGATGGTPPYNPFEIRNWNGGSQWLNVDAPTAGAVSGTPVQGTYTFQVRVRDDLGVRNQRSCTIRVSDPPAFSCPTAVATRNVAYSETLSTGDTGSQPLTWTLQSGPDWISLDASSGELSGTPTATGSFSLNILVTDANGQTATQTSCPIVVSNAPSKNCVTNPIGYVGTAYTSEAPTGSDGAGPRASNPWSRVSGQFPSGLTLNGNTGVISGTINSGANAGTYNYRLRFVDLAGAVSNIDCSIEVRRINLDCPVNPTGAGQQTVTILSATVGQAFQREFTPTGGIGPYTYSLNAAVPSWFTVSQSGSPTGTTGTLSGTPPATDSCGNGIDAPCQFSYTLTVTDSQGGTIVLNCEMYVRTGPNYSCTNTTITVSDDVQTFNLDAPLSGSPPYTFAVTVTPTVADLVVTQFGLYAQISGTFDTAGVYTICTTVTDLFGQVSSQSCCFINVLGGIDFECPNSTALTCGWTHQFVATGGSGDFRWSGTSRISSTGFISFSRNTVGSSGYSRTNWRITAVDQVSGESVQKTCPVDYYGPYVQCPVSNSVSNNDFYYAVGLPWCFQFRDSFCEGFGGCIYTAASGSSSKITIYPNGTYCGFSSTPDELRVRAIATRPDGACYNRRQCNLLPKSYQEAGCPENANNVNCGDGFVNKVRAGREWCADLDGYPSDNSYVTTYTVTGLTQTPSVYERDNLRLTGSQSAQIAPGNYTYTVRHETTTGVNTTFQCELEVTPDVDITCPPLNMFVTVPYSGSVSLSGTPPFTVEVTSGSLPNGISLDASTGALTGTPTSSASSSVTFTVSDWWNENAWSQTRGSVPKASITCAFQVTPPPVVVCPPTRFAFAGQPFSSDATATGCATTCQFSTATVLPSSFSLSSTGTLASPSTPASPGVTNVVINVQDQTTGAVASRTCPLEITQPPSALNCPPDANVAVGEQYSSTATKVGGAQGAATFSLLSGSLPPGVQVLSTGLVQGFVGAPASGPYPVTYQFQLQVTDAAGQTRNSGTCSIDVYPDLNIECPTVAPMRFGSTSTANVTVTGGLEPYDLLLQNSQSWMSLSGTEVTFNPGSAFGSFTYRVRVIDATGGSERTGFCSVVVNGALSVECPTRGDMLVGAAFSQPATGEGGRGPSFYQYSVSGPPFQIGATSGVVSLITPFATATSGSYTITLTDGIDTEQAVCSYTVYDSPQLTCPAWTLGAVTIAVPSNGDETFGVSTGSSPSGRTFTVVAGALPQGVTLNSASGSLSGTPSREGDFTYTTRLTDDAGGNVTQTCNVTIAGRPVPDCPTPTASVTVPYPLNPLVATGGTPAYTFSIQGALPSGLTLSGNQITGAPNFVGSSTFTLSVQDSVGLTGSRECTIQVSSPGCLSTSPNTTLSNASPQCTGCPTCKRTSNPCFNRACQLNAVLLLDQSGSIAPFRDQVRAGVLSFVTGIQNIVNVGGTVSLGVITFDTYARSVFPLTPITSDFANTVTDYINTEYLETFGQTNWADAFNLARNTSWGAPIDIFVMFTDGNPQSVVGPWVCEANCYEYESGPGQAFFSDLCLAPNQCTANMPPDLQPQPSGLTFKSTASNEREGLWAACTAADRLKETGSKVFMVGVGDVAENEDEIQVVTGLLEWDLQPSTFFTSDYVINRDYGALTELFTAVGVGLCPCLASYPECTAPSGVPTACSAQLFSARVKVTTRPTTVSTTFPPASEVSAYIYYQYLGGAAGRVAFDYFGLTESASDTVTPTIGQRVDILNLCQLERVVTCGTGCFSVQEQQNLPRFFLEEPDVLGTNESLYHTSTSLLGCTGYTKVYPFPTFPADLGAKSPEAIKYLWVLDSDGVSPCFAEAYDGTTYEFFSAPNVRGVVGLGETPKELGVPTPAPEFSFTPSGTCSVPECARQVELVFVIDEQFIISSDFPFIRTFVADVINATNLDGSVFGWVWSNSASDVQTLTGALREGDSTNLGNTFIKNHPQNMGTTDFPLKIQEAVQRYWPQDQSVSGFPRKLVTIVGGPNAPAAGSPSFAAVRQLLEQKGVEYWSIGVNVGAANATLLEEIASTNSYVHASAYLQGSFLKQAQGDLSLRLCPSGNLCGAECKGFCYCASPGTCECPTCVQDNCTETRVCQSIESGCNAAPKNCNDNNECTADTCDLVTGCSSQVNVDCDDRNNCTTDSCQITDGSCKNDPVLCTSNNKCEVGECNPATGGCVFTPINVTAQCGTGDACNVAECVPSIGCRHRNISSTCRDMNECTLDSCDPVMGCLYVNRTCDDMNLCTTDTCDPVSGCQHVDNSTLCDDDDMCTIDRCDATMGCIYTNVSADFCDDGNACTRDVCDSTFGCLHFDVECESTDLCLVPSCDNTTGCVFTNVTCDDNDECTNDSCVDGDCQFVFDPSRCQACAIGTCGVPFNSCEDPFCVDQTSNITCDDPRVPDKAACDIGILTGQRKYCFVAPKPLSDCDDNSECTIDSCDNSTGCVNAPRTDCVTGNQCFNEGCDPQIGCVIAPNPPCDDNKLCTIDTCDNVTGCVFTPIVCDDQNNCTADACSESQGGICVYTPIDCSLNDLCFTTSCDPALGCQYEPVVCSDGNLCTADSCDPQIGCVFTPNPPCNDFVNCTVDSCDPQLGCLYQPLTCSPPSNCSFFECEESSGTCISRSISCNDTNPCTTDTCSEELGGCQYTPVECFSTSKCEIFECNNVTGACDFVANVTCDDRSSCTEDLCLADQGCVARNKTCPAGATSCVFAESCVGDGPEPVCSYVNITSLIDFCGVCQGDNTDCFFSSLLGTGQVTAITAGVIAGIVVAAIVVALIAAYLSRKGYQYYKNVSDLNSAGAVQNPYFKDSEFGGNMVNP